MIGVLSLYIKYNVLSRASPFSLLHVQKRYKKKKTPKVTNTMRALDYFDIAYPPVYGMRWPSIRLALLSKPKYISVVNNFANHEEVVKAWLDLGALDLGPRIASSVEKISNSIMRRLDDTPDVQNEDSAAIGLPGTIRPSFRELTDDEIVARITEEDIRRYPEEYKKRALAKMEYIGEADVDLTNRVLLPSQIGPDGSLMMDHVPSDKLKGLENWIEETDAFLDINQGDEDMGLKIERQEQLLQLPPNLKVFSFLKGDISDFPHPKADRTLSSYDHYPLDGGSLLPVLALDIKPGDHMLDLCAAPGGKSLIALQTLMLGRLVCNDVSVNRQKRLINILNQYIPECFASVNNTVEVRVDDGCELQEEEMYDKVLVDVPCLTDRHSLKEDDNNIFAVKRVKERLRLPEVQAQLLLSAIKAVRPGGTVVYSTCTLSPLQNDGVVRLAFNRIWQETKIDCVVIDLSDAVQPLSFLYRFGSKLGLRYGQIVLPSLLNNFGPMYIAKIKRLR
ncbi:5-methylcytosine rRNA methyltransferase nsun4 [Halocaridina rubra]|uniref:NOL1/NOP2/Sun domain family member 4 n=1 Tax=Halocaridina rubra TaxID=373956 RepID=A0AAN8X958_HALRR